MTHPCHRTFARTMVPSSVVRASRSPACGPADQRWAMHSVLCDQSVNSQCAIVGLFTDCRMLIHTLMHMPIHIAIRMYICMFLNMSIHMSLSIQMPIHMSVHMLMHALIHMSIHMFAHTSIHRAQLWRLRFHSERRVWFDTLYDNIMVVIHDSHVLRQKIL